MQLEKNQTICLRDELENDSFPVIYNIVMTPMFGLKEHDKRRPVAMFENWPTDEAPEIPTLFVPLRGTV